MVVEGIEEEAISVTEAVLMSRSKSVISSMEPRSSPSTPPSPSTISFADGGSGQKGLLSMVMLEDC